MAKRRSRERAYLDALGTLTATYESKDSNYAILRATVVTAEIDLKRLQMKIMKHQLRHAAETGRGRPWIP
jgi:hypothetical protein